jgi:hypothetical protein
MSMTEAQIQALINTQLPTNGVGNIQAVNVRTVFNAINAQVFFLTPVTANMIFYYRTDGNDLNSGLVDSPTGAFKTLQGAYNTVTGQYNFNGFTVTIQHGGETGVRSFAGLTIVGGWIGGGQLIWAGNGNAANTVWTSNSGVGDAISIQGSLTGQMTLTGFTLTAQIVAGNAGNGIGHYGAGVIQVGTGMIFGTCLGYHITAGSSGASIYIWPGVSVTVSGNALGFLQAFGSGWVQAFQSTITFSGNPTFSQGLLVTSSGGNIGWQEVTVSGSYGGPAADMYDAFGTITSDSTLPTSGGYNVAQGSISFAVGGAGFTAFWDLFISNVPGGGSDAIYGPGPISTVTTGNGGVWEMDCYMNHNSQAPAIGVFAAQGVFGTPSAIQSGNTILQLFAVPYGPNGGFGGSATAEINFVASENMGNANGGTQMDFLTTPNGTITSQKAGSFLNSGILSTNYGTADASFSLQSPVNVFSITLGNQIETLVLNAGGTLASGTIIMPSAPVNGQRLKILSTHTITTLTLTPNAGQTVLGSPGTIATGGVIDLIYATSTLTWYA